MKKMLKVHLLQMYRLFYFSAAIKSPFVFETNYYLGFNSIRGLTRSNLRNYFLPRLTTHFNNMFRRLKEQESF